MQTINATKKIVIYSHDTMGLGHVRRNLLIATALVESHLNASVLLISGTHHLSEFDLPEGVDSLTLPGIKKSISGDYSSRQYKLELQEIINLRSRIIEAAIDAFDPDIFIADNVPRGVKFELDLSLQLLNLKPGITRILGIRDILDTPEVTKQEWHKKQNAETIQDFYDAVWVYGDQNFFNTTKEYNFSEPLNKKLVFTGYLDPLCRHQVKLSSKNLKKAKKHNLPESFHLCLAGGGQDGVALTRAFADAIIDSDFNGVILTGPFLPDKAFKKLKKRVKGIENIKLIKFYHEPINLIKMADKVVSMGGYNSVSEILSLHKTAIIIPRVEPRKEQWMRAKKLSDWKLIDVMHPDELCSSAIKQWLETDHKIPEKRKTLDFDGLNRIVKHVDEYLKKSEKAFELLDHVA